jgi:hypothetical protein
MIAQGSFSVVSRTIAQPKDVDPKSSASRYRIDAIADPQKCVTGVLYIELRYTPDTKMIGICALDANKLKDAPNGKPLHAAFVILGFRAAMFGAVV